MFNKSKILLIVLTIAFPFILLSYAHAKPPKPGPKFVWINSHTTANGIAVPGHWKYSGAPYKGKSWIPGHYGPKGKWIAGHWNPRPKPKRGVHWVPGHHGKGGRWVPGHWK